MESCKIRLTLEIINGGIVETTFQHTSKQLGENDKPEDVGYQIGVMLSYLLVDSGRYFDVEDSYECFTHCIASALEVTEPTEKNKYARVLDATYALMRKKLEASPKN